MTEDTYVQTDIDTHTHTQSKSNTVTMQCSCHGHAISGAASFPPLRTHHISICPHLSRAYKIHVDKHIDEQLIPQESQRAFNAASSLSSWKANLPPPKQRPILLLHSISDSNRFCMKKSTKDICGSIWRSPFPFEFVFFGFDSLPFLPSFPPPFLVSSKAQAQLH